MKKLFALLIVFGAVGFTAAQAQDGGKGGAMAKRMTDSMTVQLSLTPEQVTKVQTINEEFSTKAASVRSEGGDKMDRLKKIKAANNDRDAALKAVLTDEQFKTYKEHKKENKVALKDRHKGRKRQG